MSWPDVFTDSPPPSAQHLCQRHCITVEAQQPVPEVLPDVFVGVLGLSHSPQCRRAGVRHRRVSLGSCQGFRTANAMHECACTPCAPHAPKATPLPVIPTPSRSHAEFTDRLAFGNGNVSGCKLAVWLVEVCDSAAQVSGAAEELVRRTQMPRATVFQIAGSSLSYLTLSQ